MNHIDRETYSKIHALMPILCVDLLIVHAGEVLLVKRNTEPDKGKWWIPGGRVWKNESLEAAVHRQAAQLGMEVEIKGMLGHLDLDFKEDPFGHGRGTHTVSLVYACASKGREVKLDEFHDDYHWWGGKSNLRELSNTVRELVEGFVKRR